jgi:hypothetical protein
MHVSIVDPLKHRGWDQLLLESRDENVFHTEGWAKTLALSYGYRPLYFGCFNGDRLSFLMPLMEVASGLTGKRGVSLPFSDHCRVFYDKKENFEDAVDAVVDLGRKSGWKYVEWRDPGIIQEGISTWEEHYTHDIDLSRVEQELYLSLQDSNRRNIKKALREGLSVKVAADAAALADFCRLNRLTRKRHGLPPQPAFFFRQLYENLLSDGKGNVITVYSGWRAVSSSIFLHFGTSVIYKYGASDEAYFKLRPNNLVLWTAIKWYQEHGYKNLNLGKTEAVHAGLLRFKREWGGGERIMPYYRFDIRVGKFARNKHKRVYSASILARLPSGFLSLLGRFMYKHMG